jgi:hypothetical protein
MKFAKLVKGVTDVRTVFLVLAGVPEPVKLGQRPLTAMEETDVIERARAFAKSKGVDKPTDDDPLYVMAIWANTLLLACTSLGDDDKGEPFFGDVNEILEGLDRDRISFLYESQQRIQEDHGCRKERLTPDEMMAAVHEIVTKDVGDPSLPFWNWGPSLRASFMHFLACQLFLSRMPSSPPTSTSDNAAKSAEKKPE